MKRGLKKLLTAGLAGVMAFSLMACGNSSNGASNSSSGSNSGSSDGKIVWRVGHNNAEDHYWNVYMQKWGELVNEKTDGKVEVQVYANSQLGDDAAMGEMIRNGNLDMMITGACVPGKWYRPMTMMEMSGLFDDMDHVERAIYGEAGEIMKKGCEEQGIMLWDNWMRTSWEFMTTKPVSQLSDFKGLKVRVTPDDVWITHMEGTYGLSASPMAFSEVFSSLQQGVVEGVLNPISSMYTMRFHEVCDNLVITKTNFDFAPILVSPSSWEKLPEDIQNIMWECEEEIREEVNEYIRTEDDKYIALMQEENPNLTITYLDSNEVIESAKKIHQEVVDTLGAQEVYDAIRACSNSGQ